MHLVKTYLDKSPIEGIGVFAAEDIPKGAIIWKFHHPVDIKLDKSDMGRIEKNFNPIQKHFVNRYMYMDEAYYILCGDNARFTNHSDNPNCTCRERDVIANRDIKKGEELTENYNEFNDNWSPHEFAQLKSYKDE